MKGYEDYHLALDCPQCGEKDKVGEHKGGRMGSTTWGHNYMCCSDACGVRLGVRIRNKMFFPELLPSNWPYPPWELLDAQRMRDLRTRIKQLEHQILRRKK